MSSLYSKLFEKKPEPIKIRDVNAIHALIREMPPLEDLNLSQTLNTTVACRVCRGNGYHLVRNKYTNQLTQTYCLHCKSTREMRNGDGT